MKLLYFSTLIWSATILPFSILNLPPISGLQNETDTRCTALFNCGKLRGITYPFWGGDRAEECGYPGLKLDCENATTTIQMSSVKYQVLDLNQQTQLLKITRNDFSQNLCQQQLTNTSLDSRIFEYSTGYINLTFLYGCPAMDFPVPDQFECAVNGTKEINGYVEFGTQFSGMCHASVVVPVSYTSFINFKDVKQLVREGFEVRFKVVESGACSDCQSSGGRCGYDVAGNKFVCFCPNGSAAKYKTCAAGVVGDDAGDYSPRASAVTASGTHAVDLFPKSSIFL